VNAIKRNANVMKKKPKCECKDDSSDDSDCETDFYKRKIVIPCRYS